MQDHECPKCHWKNSLYKEGEVLRKALRAFKNERKQSKYEEIANRAEIIFMHVFKILFLMAFCIITLSFLRFHVWR